MIKAGLIRLARGSVIYGIGGLLQRFIALILLPLFTKELDPDDYGVVTLISIIGIAMSGALTLGTINSMGLLYFRESDIEKRPSIIWTCFILLTINGCCWFVLVYMISPYLSTIMFRTEEFADVIRLAFLGKVIITITDPFLAYLRMEEKAKQYMILTVFGALLTTCLSVYFVLWVKLKVFGLIIAGVIGSAINFGIIGFFVAQRVPVGFNPKLIKPLVRIGFPSIFGLFAFLLIDYADRQMIERILGLTQLGVYSVGYSFGLIMAIVSGAFSTAWPPFFMSFSQKLGEAREVFGQVLKYYVIGFGSLIVVFYSIAKPLVILMTNNSFHKAWAVVGLVAASHALKGCYLIFLPGIYFENKISRQSVIEWIAAVLNLALNLWLIPIYGLMGAAVATFASYLTLSVLGWAVGRTYLDVNYQWGRIFFIIAFIVVWICGIQHFFNSSLEILTVQIIRSCSILLIYMLIAFYFILNRQERQFIRGKLKI